MSLLLTISAAPASASISESGKTFDVQGGTIGRGKENTWVLDDPDRFLSALHCRISSENGEYYLTDLSTNGTFLNAAPHPMGKGCKSRLRDGDKFSLGDYEFSVSLWSPAQPSFASPGSEVPSRGQPQDPAQTHDPFLAALEAPSIFAQNSTSSSPFDRGLVSPTDSLFGVLREETDPIAALDKARGTPSFGSSNYADVFGGGPSFSDQAEALNQQVNWPYATPEPGSGGVIPDDWDRETSPAQESYDPFSQKNGPGPSPRAEVPIAPAKRSSRRGAKEPVSETLHGRRDTEASGQFSGEPSLARQTAIEEANAKIAAELAILKQQVMAQSRNAAADITVDSSLVDALGFHGQGLTDERITEINSKAGEVIRETVKGLMQVLSARSAIKNEFRMNVTTIQPVENNPLKFSANVNDALENMFVKQGNAYMKPVEAVREGFDSIGEHQIAVIAGIRAAFKGVIERFDPSRLEERFQKQRKGGLLPGIQKAKNWELYNKYYNELAGDLDNSFQFLFGDEFVQAYEDQLRKLAVAKKAKTKSGDK